LFAENASKIHSYKPDGKESPRKVSALVLLK